MRKRWLQTHVDGVGLPTKLVGDWLENNLAYAYDYYMGLKAALLRKKLKYYDFISYSVMENDGNAKRICIQVGDIVDIEEETEGVAHAQVKAIVTHIELRKTKDPEEDIIVIVIEQLQQVSGWHQKVKLTIDIEYFLFLSPMFS